MVGIWWRISLQLCIFGFLKEVRPSEPYIYDYLIGRWKNFTDNQIQQDIYPVGTYAYLLLLLFVFLFTDLLRYKPLIIVLGLSGIITWSMLLWCTELYQMQIMEVFYGIFTACEIAYYTYIYAKVSNEHFQKVSSHTRAATLFGRALSGILSQTLTSTNVLNYQQLNYITFACVILATIWSLFLPSVTTTIYFHRETQTTTNSTTTINKFKMAFEIMKEHFMIAFKNISTLKWSIWWSLSTCAYIQIENYMQPLYAAIEGDGTVAYNGAVEGILTFCSFLSALAAGYLPMKYSFYKSELFLSILTLIQGILIIICSRTTSIYLCYVFYIVYGVVYHFLITIANAQIAEKLPLDSYGLIFGINLFVALVFNSLLTLIVINICGLLAREQYFIYGCYLFITALIFLIFGINKLLKQCKTNQIVNNNKINTDGEQNQTVNHI